MKEPQIALINEEINRELSDEKVGKALLATTFKGLNAISMKQAIMEGMIRGFKFRDFLEKNVYAIPYGSGYSLVTSIDYARKKGMRAGIVGKSAPLYEVNDTVGKILSCSVTVKRKVGEYIGEYTATVFFDEYTTGKNLWATKPRTMIAKVAEMHALRMACPEELSQTYVEEEFGSERVPHRSINAAELKKDAPTIGALTANKPDHDGKDEKDAAGKAEQGNLLDVAGSGEGDEDIQA